MVALLAACGGGADTAKQSAIPRDRGASIGLTVDAALAAGPGAIAPFDDGDGHGGATPDGGYSLGARQTESVVSATVPGTLPADQLVQAEIDSSGTALDDGFGVVCRWQNNNTFYRLGIGNDGTFGIARVENGTSTVLSGGGQWIRDRQLATTPGRHLVGGQCRGTHFTLFADNRAIAEVEDSAINRPGRVGVFVETFADPNASVTVRRLRAFAYPNRDRVPDTAVGPWDAFSGAQPVAHRCTLLDPKRARFGGTPEFVTRCGQAIFAKYADGAGATAEFTSILTGADSELTNTRRLPDCRKRTGVLGPLPPTALPVPPGTPPGIGRVACLDLGDRTAVVWLDSGPGLVGISTLADDDRQSWRGYGPTWPPFTAGPAAAGA